VDIEINGVPAPVRMKLGETGEAFFVEEIDSEEDLDDGYLATSPLPSSPRYLGSDDIMASHISQMQPDDNLSSDEKFKTDVSIQVTEEQRSSENATAEDEDVAENVSNVIKEDLKGKKKRRRRRKNQVRFNILPIQVQSVKFGSYSVSSQFSSSIAIASA